MFENYLEDAHHFLCEAREARDERTAKRHYRAAVFYAMGAIEAFINFVADTFSHGTDFPIYEVAFLQDKRFGLEDGEFHRTNQPEYHKIEDKLRFLIHKFIPDFDFGCTPAWSRLLELKSLRDTITHPRHDEDNTSIAQYEQMVSCGLSAVIDIMNRVSNGIFGRPLRRRLTDLSP